MVVLDDLDNLTDKEILKLGSEELEERKEVMSLVTGPAGVGKTYPHKPDITIKGSCPELEAHANSVPIPDNVLALIARKNLSFKTLKTQNSDSLDFKEVSVWSVKRALEEAFKAGYDRGTDDAYEDIRK